MKKAFLFFAPAMFFVLMEFFSCKSAGVESGAQAGEAFFVEGQGAESIFFPERQEEIPFGATRVNVKASKKNASVYVNNEFLGYSPLSVDGLVPGRYFLCVKKEGYKEVQIAIQVKDGVSDYYYIELEAARLNSSRP